jgi:peptidoglycan/LPS O-acetylase OafA/YrhL
VFAVGFLLPAPQAWFPAHAEIWNAPTWFLSALTFAMVVLPHVLPAIASMRKKGLKLLLVCAHTSAWLHACSAHQ